MPGTSPYPEIPPRIEQAAVDWTPEGEPISRRHGDVYFSRDNGLAETDYVFLQGNQLSQRFKQLGNQPDHFVIAETGFGTGLNFLAAARLWLETCAPGQVLHFVSFERYPLSRGDLERALARWPELRVLASALLDQYPEPVQGSHRLVLFGGGVRLTLYWGDALQGMEQLEFIADAWFLDGFAPAKNPELWQARLLQAIASHSRTGCTLSTFTAAGAVRRQLAAAGFSMEKRCGFGRKREMLCGLFAPVTAESTSGSTAPPKSVVIIGGGMAGCMAARALATRGLRVTLLEAGPGPAQGASGNPQGALYVKLGVDFNAQTRMALSGLLFSQRLYRCWQARHDALPFWHATGLLQLAWNQQEQQRQAKFLGNNRYPESLLQAVDPARASDIAGIPIQYPGLWFPHSGWVCPPLLCWQALRHPGIDTHFNTAVQTLSPGSQTRWQVSASDGRHWQTDRVILCNGVALAQLAAAVGVPVPIKPIRGQVTTTAEHLLPRTSAVLCADGYLNPPWNGQTLIGASFDLRDSDPAVRLESHQQNLERLASWLPASVAGNPDPGTDCEGRVAFRATLPDYQPLAGPFSAKDQGLYGLGGLGSKGLSFAPLLSELLADLICQQPACLEKDLIGRLSPMRFQRSEK